MTTSADLIARFEGYRDNPYWDVNAYRAGFGSDTTTLPDGTIVPIRQGMRVTREDSLRDLQRRIENEFQPSVVNAIGADAWGGLSPDQQAVLNSLAYNYGAGAWGKGLAGVAAAVRTPGRDDDVAAIRALQGHNDGVNRGRRNREADIYAGAGEGYAIQTGNALAASGAGYAPVDLVALVDAPQARQQRTTAEMPGLYGAPQQVAYAMPTNALAGYVPQFDTRRYLTERLMRG